MKQTLLFSSFTDKNTHNEVTYSRSQVLSDWIKLSVSVRIQTLNTEIIAIDPEKQRSATQHPLSVFRTKSRALAQSAQQLPLGAPLASTTPGTQACVSVGMPCSLIMSQRPCLWRKMVEILFLM